MLSKQSEQFLLELRLYLISKGKNDQEINEVTEELEVHLLEAEAEGKDVTTIIGESPKQYMKNSGDVMKTDFRQLAGLIPMMILLIAAYLSFGPAIEGAFALSAPILWIALIGSIFSLAIYSLFLFKVYPHFFNQNGAIS